MASRFTLNSTVVDDPKGWDTAIISAVRSSIARGLFTEFVIDLEFTGNGSELIYNEIKSNLCGEVDILIETDDCDDGVFITEFKGVIPLTQVTEIRRADNTQSCSLKAKLVDKGFTARIVNNKDLTAVVTSDISKNGVALTPTTVTLIDFFDPTTGNYDFLNVRCFKIFNALTFVIKYITDDEVTFISDLLDTGDYENKILTTGSAIRDKNGFPGSAGISEDVDVSFFQIVEEVNKVRNVSWGINTDSNGDPVFRLEPVEFFFNDEASFAIGNVAGISTSSNTKELYSSIDVGSEEFILQKTGSLSYPDSLLKGFRKENYTLKGTCNESTVLNLVSKFVIDSNQIENVLRFNDEETDENIFLVDTDGTLAIQTDPFNLGTFAYNEIFTNFNKINNWAKSLHNDVTKSLGPQVNNFDADLTADISSFFTNPTTPAVILVDPVIYDNQINDPGGNYNPVNGRYVIPVASDGLYGFKTSNTFFINGNLGSEEVTNGSFASSSDWVQGAGWNIAAGVAQFSRTFRQTDIGNLTQTFSTALSGGGNYNLTFDLGELVPSTFNGQCDVSVNNTLLASFTTLGTKTIQLAAAELGDIFNVIFSATKTENLLTTITRFTIDNVSIKGAPTVEITNRIQRMDSAAAVVIESFEKVDTITLGINPLVSITQLIDHSSGTFTAFGGEVIRASVVLRLKAGNNTTITIKANSTYESVLTNDAGGDLFAATGEFFFPLIHEVKETDITLTQWREMIDNPELSIVFNNGNQTITNFRDKLTYNRATGKLSFKLLSKTLID